VPQGRMSQVLSTNKQHPVEKIIRKMCIFCVFPWIAPSISSIALYKWYPNLMFEMALPSSRQLAMNMEALSFHGDLLCISRSARSSTFVVSTQDYHFTIV